MNALDTFPTASGIPVAHHEVDERLTFIRKTYIHLLVGLMAFSGVVFAIMQSALVVDPVTNAAGPLLRVNPFVWFGALLGLSLGYRWIFSSRSMAVHYVGFGLTIGLEAVICAPLFWYAQNAFPHAHILRDAFMLTSLGFGGLTAYVLMTKKDFSFMRGFLTIATLVLIGAGFIGALTGGFGLNILLPAITTLVFGGWVLYDTSMIQRQLPLNGYVFGATMLFIDFVVILRNVVWMLTSLNDD
jgi:FtsH-binding integral membrane protein